jgi:hypothetical protein
LKLKLFQIFFITGLNCISAQQFGPDIIIDSTSINIDSRGGVLNTDNENNLGVAWIDYLSEGNDIVYFTRSTDGGNSFSEKVIIEGDSIDPIEELRSVSAVFFDSQNNPLVNYIHGYFPYYFYHRIKKSFDKGVTFPNEPSLNMLSDSPASDFLWDNSTVNFFSVQQFSGINLILTKTYDEGLTFSDSVIINTGENSPNGHNLVKLTSEDLFCFWNGQDINTHRNSMYFNRSTDGGNSFGGFIEIDTISFNPVGIEAVSFDTNIFLIYQRRVSNNYQLLFEKSSDGGYTFSEPKVIVEWPVPGSVSGSGHLLLHKPNFGLCLLWNNRDYNNPVTYFTRSRDEGSTFDSTVIVNYNRQGSNSMAVSDSGDIYVISTEVNTNHLVLNKAKLDPVTSVGEDFDIINSYQLYQNYPNPFNPVTTIKYSLKNEEKVTIKVYNAIGQEVKVLTNEIKPAGYYEVQLNASNLASGMYIYRMQTADYTLSRKMLILK